MHRKNIVYVRTYLCNTNRTTSRRHRQPAQNLVTLFFLNVYLYFYATHQNVSVTHVGDFKDGRATTKVGAAFEWPGIYLAVSTRRQRRGVRFGVSHFVPEIYYVAIKIRSVFLVVVLSLGRTRIGWDLWSN